MVQSFFNLLYTSSSTYSASLQNKTRRENGVEIMGISIIGTGSYIPKKAIVNKDFEKIIDTTDEWITTRTGINKRYVVSDENTTTMGGFAAKGLVKKHNIDPLSIDVILVSTVTADYLTPSTACIVANEIGATNAISFDINVACAGFVYALDLANMYLDRDEYNRVLIVSSETMSKITDYEDRTTCVLFGDGAGACLLEKSAEDYHGFMGSDPTGVSKLFARGVMPTNPFMETEYDRNSDGFADTKGNFLYQNGKEVYKFATRTVPLSVETVCKKANITPEDLDWIIPHQANIRIIETAAKNLKVSLDKFLINIREYGNMSSACIPVCVDQALQDGRLQKGQKVCMVGFGAGLAYGAVILTI